MYKTSENIFLVFKRSFASVVTRELGLNDNSFTDTPLHKKGSFQLRISSVNVTKSAVSC